MKSCGTFLAVYVVLQAISCTTGDGTLIGKSSSTDTTSPDASASTEEHEGPMDSREDTRPEMSPSAGRVPAEQDEPRGISDLVELDTDELGTEKPAAPDAPDAPDAADAAVESEDTEGLTSGEAPGAEDAAGPDPSTEGGGECKLPPCLAQIDFESCQPDTREACSATGGHPPTSLDTCYENGVKARSVWLLSDSVVSLKTAAGADCYSLEIVRAETIQYIWKTPEGNTVTTGTAQRNEPDIVTYHCDGQRYVVDFSDPTCSFVATRPLDTSLAGCVGGCTY